MVKRYFALSPIFSFQPLPAKFRTFKYSFIHEQKMDIVSKLRRFISEL
jgi:hypothetical protein